MDKNTIIGLVLMAAVLIGFSYYNTQQQPVQQPAPEQTAQPKQAATPTPTTSAAAMLPDSTDRFYTAEQKAEYITLRNNKVSVKISTKGATVAEVKLNEYKSYSDFAEGKENPLLLYSEKDAGLDLVLETKERNMRLADYCFTPENVTDSTVTLTLASKDNAQRISLVYKLLTDNYLLNCSLHTSGMGNLCKAGGAPLYMAWHDRVARHEKGFYFENMYSTLTYKTTDDDVEKLAEQQTEEESVTAGVNWIAFKNQYFSSVLIAAAPMKNVEVKSEQLDEKSGYLKAYNAQMETTVDPTGEKATDFQYYFGPNNYRLLQSMDDFRITAEEYELQDLVYLGWPLFKWINRYFTLYVFDFFTRMNLPMGIVLLLITLLLRIIVYAPTRKSYMSSAKMRVLKPKVDEISKKYPKQEDAMKRQQEIMTLYSQYGVSPMGGCLPMLIQMPIWIAMFNFVPNAIELRQQSFLWADDLSTYDDLISWNFEIWGLGNHLSLFCLLFCACNLLYSYLMMRQQKETMSGEQAQQMKLMQWMMMLMPLFFFFMFNKYSAGLNYYYFISLLFSALTMWYLRKTTDDAKLLAKLEENYKANKNNPNKKPTGLAARLEALQKQQQEMLEQQRKRNGR